MSRLDSLAIDSQGFRGRWCPRVDANLFSKACVNLLPSAIEPPVAELSVDGLPGWEIVWHQPPSSTGSQMVEDGIDHVSEFDGDRPTTFGCAGLGLREERFQLLPLGIRQIGWV